MQDATVRANLSTDRPKNGSSASNGVTMGPGVHQWTAKTKLSGEGMWRRSASII